MSLFYISPRLHSVPFAKQTQLLVGRMNYVIIFLLAGGFHTVFRPSETSVLGSGRPEYRSWWSTKGKEVMRTVSLTLPLRRFRCHSQAGWGLRGSGESTHPRQGCGCKATKGLLGAPWGQTQTPTETAGFTFSPLFVMLIVVHA